MSEYNKLLEDAGWLIECESPFNISHEESQSEVSGNYAVFCIRNEIILSNKLDELDEKFKLEGYQKCVTYETAIKLKEVGFDEKTELIYYTWLGNYEILVSEDSTNSEMNKGALDDGVYTNTWISCPTIEQVIDWLELKHNCDVFTKPYISPQPKRYKPCILNRGEIIELKPVSTKKDAILSAINYSLDKLIRC